MNIGKIKLLSIFVIGVSGITAGAFATGVLGVPKAGLVDKGDWQDVSNETVNISSTGYVYNPNNFALNLSNLDVAYRLKMNGVVLAKGAKEGISIEKDSNQTISVLTSLKPEKIPRWWASHLKNGEKSNVKVPLSAEISLFSKPLKLSGYSHKDTIETDIESMMDNSVSEIRGNYSWSLTGADVTETRLEVLGGSAEFGKVSRDNTEFLIDLKIHNPNDYAIPIPQFTGDLEMNTIRVVEWDANNVEVVNGGSDAVIAPGETRNIEIKAVMTNDKIDDWFVSHAANRERTEGKINLKLAFDVAGNRLEFPSSEGINCGFSIRTGILVDNQTSSSSYEGCSYEGVLSNDLAGAGSSLTDSNTLSNTLNGSDSSDITGSDSSGSNSSDGIVSEPVL